MNRVVATLRGTVSATIAFLLIQTLVLGASQARAADDPSAPDPSLTDAERSRLVELYKTSQDETEALVAKAEGDHWTAKPAEDRWSVAEVVEHLALAEEGIFALATGALAEVPDPEWEATAATGIDGMMARVQDRSQRFQAPEVFQPKGEMSRDQLLARYVAARAKTLAFVEKTEAPVKKHSAMGPPGKLSVHQWLALIGAHNLRHNQQIQEVLDTIDG